MVRSFDEINETKETFVPILFIYGADKQFNIHTPEFEEKIRNDEGSKVVGLKLLGKHVGHWLPFTAPDEINKEIENWL